jgi:DNA-binding FadR family transcriptional regulator
VSRFDTYRRADIRFHIALAEASGSKRLVAAMTEVQGEMSDLIALIAHPEAVLARSNTQHDRLVKLVERGEGTRAVKLMREHLAGTEHILFGLMPASQRPRRNGRR